MIIRIRFDISWIIEEMTEPLNYYGTPDLAAFYDDDCAGREDLQFYVALASRLGPGAIADIGCGTGLLASTLAQAGFTVTAVEPQLTMLQLAAQQAHAGEVTWVHGTAAALAPRCADLALMTGHVAQYFLDDESWLTGLSDIRRALRPGSHLAFEVRNPATESWRRWVTWQPRPISRGTIEQTVQQTGDLVTHVDEYVHNVKRWITSETLRFPSWDRIMRGLRAAHFEPVQTHGVTGTAARSPTSHQSGSSLRPGQKLERRVSRLGQASAIGERADIVGHG